MRACLLAWLATSAAFTCRPHLSTRRILVRARSEASDVTTARDGVALREADHSPSTINAINGLQEAEPAEETAPSSNDELLLFRNRCMLLQARVLELQRQANEQSAALRSMEDRDAATEISWQVRTALLSSCELTTCMVSSHGSALIAQAHSDVQRCSTCTTERSR
jgi:hypothetical protein